MPDPVRLQNTIRMATEACRHTPGRKGRYLELTDVEDVVVAGDLHGHVNNFRKLLDFSDLLRHSRRHLIVQELIHGNQFYPETGGDQSHRLVDLIAATKALYPTRVHYLLGNHELSQWTNRSIGKNNQDLNQLFMLGLVTAYHVHAENIAELYKELFRALPAAIRLPNRVFLSHSMPGLKRLASWTLDAVTTEALCDADISLGGGLHSIVWGRETAEATVKKFLQIVNADLLVSGHIPCDNGHETPNPFQLILDSKDDQGSACLIPADRPITQADLLKGIVKLKDLR